ncbi:MULTISPECIES: hypothetical protein [Xanthobacter]|uniref:hypothetical protein n=1 Tax=Xanthobacter TaxID=279 RepID=UPI002022EB31|nr:hypothetical protein [Xanthobacter aminoxidans]MCL8381006.1 hypothetical protein [Xanthobacter aminoxidans]
MSQTDAELDALDRLRRLTRRLNLDVAAWRLKLALKGSYDPSQPRIPSGQPGGGRWAGGSDGSTGPKPTGAERRVSMAARRISPAAEAECERLNKRDTAYCTAIKNPACHGQASLRYAFCLAGKPIPPLPF